jgi:hypothetical protein
VKHVQRLTDGQRAQFRKNARAVQAAGRNCTVTKFFQKFSHFHRTFFGVHAS